MATMEDFSRDSMEEEAHQPSAGVSHKHRHKHSDTVDRQPAGQEELSSEDPEETHSEDPEVTHMAVTVEDPDGHSEGILTGEEMGLETVRERLEVSHRTSELEVSHRTQELEVLDKEAFPMGSAEAEHHHLHHLEHQHHLATQIQIQMTQISPGSQTSRHILSTGRLRNGCVGSTGYATCCMRKA